ncbi:MAG TPA: hypothetical protein VES67_24685 [Vicinamibacterales bacterium]|nr:hypothetical protein [Vicinamibacterales bacterium]
MDRLILERWTDVVALREAFDELLDRMSDTVEGAILKAERWAGERNWGVDHGLKDPYLDVYKQDWTRKREAVLYFRISEFAPHEYGDVTSDHPWVWLMTEELARFKLSESDRIQFARELRGALGADASRWDHRDTVEASEPLGQYYTSIRNADRIRWMSHPDELTEFLTDSMEEAMALAPTIDGVLARFRKA